MGAPLPLPPPLLSAPPGALLLVARVVGPL
jgi:hypothetical protein